MSVTISLDGINVFNQSLNAIGVQNLKTTWWSRWWSCLCSQNENCCLNNITNKTAWCYFVIIVLFRGFCETNICSVSHFVHTGRLQKKSNELEKIQGNLRDGFKKIEVRDRLISTSKFQFRLLNPLYICRWWLH